MCFSFRIQIVSFLKTMHKLKLSRIDEESAILISGKALRFVYVCPPAECAQQNSIFQMWIVTAYGLVKANSKLHKKSERGLNFLSLEHAHLIFWLFVLKNRGKLCQPR